MKKIGELKKLDKEEYFIKLKKFNTKYKVWYTNKLLILFLLDNSNMKKYNKRNNNP